MTKWIDLYPIRRMVLNASTNLVADVLEKLEYDRLSEPRTLDLACGEGYFCMIAPEYLQGKITGVDTDESFLAKARKQHNETFVRGDFNHLDFPDNSFDLIVGINQVDFVADIDSVLRETRRVLKPNGWYLHMADAKFNWSVWERSQFRESIEIVPTYTGRMDGDKPHLIISEYEKQGTRTRPYQVCILDKSAIKGKISGLVRTLQDLQLSIPEGMAAYQALLTHIRSPKVMSIPDFFISDSLEAMHRIGFKNTEHRLQQGTAVGERRGDGPLEERPNQCVLLQGDYAFETVPLDTYAADGIVLKPDESLQMMNMHLLIGQK